MTIRLGKAREARWIPLRGKARLYCSPISTSLVYAARAAAAQLLVDMIAGGVAMTKAGATVEGLPDLNDLVAVEATRQSLFLVCLAEMAATDWQGILGPGEDDGPVAFDAAHLAGIFTDPEVADSFSRFYLSGHTEVVAEGNA